LLCKRTFGDAFFRIAGTSLGDGIALSQTFLQLLDGDFALGHQCHLISEAIIAVSPGKHIAGCPLAVYGIQRDILEDVAVDIDGSGIFCFQSVHRAGGDALSASIALFLDCIGFYGICFQRCIGDDADEFLIVRNAYPDEKISQTFRNMRISNVFKRLNTMDAQVIVVKVK